MFQIQRNVRANRAGMAGHVQMGWTYTVVNAFLDTLAPTAKQVCTKSLHNKYVHKLAIISTSNNDN